MATNVRYTGRGSVEDAIAVFAAELTDLDITLEDVRPVVDTPCSAPPAGVTIFDSGWSFVPYTEEAPDAVKALEGAAELSVFLDSGLVALDTAEALAVLDARAATLMATTQFQQAEYADTPDRLKFKGGVAMIVDRDDPKVLAGLGDDILWGSGGTNVLSGGWGDDVILGDGGSDILYSNAGNDLLIGGQGGDEIHANGGLNIVDGGGGGDTLVMQGRAEDYEIDLFRFTTDFDGDGTVVGGETVDIARVAQAGTRNVTWAVDVKFFEFRGVTREKEVDAFGLATWHIEDAEDVVSRFDDLFEAATDAAGLSQDLLAIAGLDISADELVL
ncbi:MAG: calcium-binding protein [Pseudomonadota bacterium]